MSVPTALRPPLAADAGSAPKPVAAAALVAVGSLGVVVVSALYGVSPPAAALPAPFDLQAAIAGARAGAATLQAAGTLGVVADVALIIGAFGLSLDRTRHGESVAAMGWFALALATALFVGVDALAGFVLSPLAERSDGAAAFEGFKRLFDALFLLGSATLGAGSLAALVDAASAKRLGLPGAIVRAGRIAGVALLASVCARILGFPAHLAAGLSVAFAAIVFVTAGVAIARGGAPDSR